MVPQPGMVPQGPTPGGTGHAPMVADGYYAAATGGGMSPGGPAQTQYPQPQGGQSWPPQHAVDQQPSWQRSGTAGSQGPPWQQPSGPAYTPQQPPSTPWAQPAQSTWPRQQGAPTPWPTAGGPGAPGTPNPLAQYTPARRRPARTEIPSVILTATRLMYLGAAVTALYAMFGTFAAVHDNRYSALHPFSHAGQQAHTMASDIAVTAVYGGAIGIVCWIVVATSCRRGHGWTRIAATILLALHALGVLAVLYSTHDDSTVKALTLIIWAIGLPAVILLWSGQASRFFLAWRRLPETGTRHGTGPLR